VTDLEWLIERCVSVHCSFNAHRDYHQTAAEVFAEDDTSRPRARMLDGMDPEVRDQCIARDSLLELQIYPNTPVGFNLYHHWNFSELCRMARADLGEEHDWRKP
jgi:hypothetical protein